MFFSFVFLLSFIFIPDARGNEVINIKTQDRGDYIRFIFELSEKPKYFVYQLGEKIYLRLKGTKSSVDAKIDNLSVKTTDNDVEYTILARFNSLKRYLYTEPTKNTKYFRVLVDVYKDEQSFENIGNFLSTKISLSNEEKTIDDLVAEFTEITLDELIKENIKPENLDELIALNNIIDEKVAEDLERQNNDGIDLENFLQQIYEIPVEPEIKKDFDKIKVGKKRKTKRFLIVIDAGHGGADSGAIGNMRTKEKDINLVFAKEIAKQLEKNGNFEVYLTRTNDKFISLRNRVMAARRLKANLFISIHSDSNPNRNVRGLSLYTLLPKRNEPASFGFSRNHYMFRQKRKISSANNIKYVESDKFVNILLQKFSNQEINTLFNPHKYARFAVLMAPEFPSVLIELGFLSNLQDEKMLNSERYKKKIGLAVSQSINRYFGYY